MLHLDPLQRDALVVLAGSLVVPTIVVLAAGRPGSTADRVLAWCCFWVGQLTLPLVLVVLAALSLARDWAAKHAWLAAIGCGLTMAFVALVTTLMLMRVFALGFAVLDPSARERMHRRADALLHRAAFVAAAAVAASFLSLAVRLPGRWDAAIYAAIVILPVLFASLCTTVLALVLRGTR